VTTAAYLLFGAVLFAVGLLGTLVPANAVGRLVGVELMLAASALTFAAAAVGFRELDGEVAALVVIVVAIAQAIVVASLVTRARRAE